MKLIKFFFLFIFLGFIFVTNIHAADLSSASFILRDPVVGAGGGFGTSTSFQLVSSNNQLGSNFGTSTSFSGKSGFLYYPFVTKGSFSATPSATSITLNWTATLAGQGLGVSGYNVGTSSVSGGPYSYVSVGSTTTKTFTALMPGTYYYILQTLDAYGNVIATSDEVSAVVTQTVTFSLTDNVAQFGSISSSLTKYANTSGGATSEVEAHQLIANTNAPSGYTITVLGAPPANGSDIITAIGSSSASPSVGTNQFGLRLVASGGSGTVATSYGASGFAYAATATTSDAVASESTGDAIDTNYSVRYVVNIDPTKSSGSYSANIIYVVTPNF